MGQGAEGWVPETTQTWMLYITPAKHLGAQGLRLSPSLCSACEKSLPWDYLIKFSLLCPFPMGLMLLPWFRKCELVNQWLADTVMKRKANEADFLGSLHALGCEILAMSGFGKPELFPSLERTIDL